MATAELGMPGEADGTPNTRLPLTESVRGVAGAPGPPALLDLDENELAIRLAAWGEPGYRTRQVLEAAWDPAVRGFDEITALPTPLRRRLAAEFSFMAVAVDHCSDADRGMTLKLLCRLADGQTVETVAMESPSGAGRRHRRATVCVSSQVGCAVGCPFCATAQMGLRRQCTVAEITDQVRAAAAALRERGLGPVTHVVYMGMGEPLANFDNTLGSLHRLSGPGGISPRRLTVSTSGVVPAIDRLAQSGLAVTLAVSLHAADDALRDRLVPLNRTWPLEQLTAAADRYARTSGRRVSLEWCLIGGVNDTPVQAASLRAVAHRLRAHVNVIPMNHVDGSPWGPPGAAVARAFLAALDGVSATVRDTRGSDADAACGQLRAGLERRRQVQPDGSLGPPRRPVRLP